LNRMLRPECSRGRPSPPRRRRPGSAGALPAARQLIAVRRSMRRLPAQAAHPLTNRAYGPNAMCHWLANAWPFSPLSGNATADDASSSTRWLLPDGEGRPATALTVPSSESFAPQPPAPGTANVSSPRIAPLTTIAPSGPFGSGVPPGSNCSIFAIAFDRSVFAGFRTIGFWSEPMKQFGPSGIPWLSRWILIGTVMIGWPSEIPANRLKFDGVPADSTVAVTSPPRTATGSAMSAPPAGATTEKTPLVLSSTSPTWRLVFPVGVVREPIVMLPCVEFDATQKLLEPVPPPNKPRVPPVAASIAGSSTGQRVNGPQSPGGVWNVVSAPVVLAAELVAITWKW